MSDQRSPAPASDPVLVCEALSYSYPDGTHATRGIDLALRRAELFCLLGPNGAGKTTLIRQITTELRPASGRVRILGRDAHADPTGTKRHLGVIPQSAGLFEALSVEDHIRLFGPLKLLSRAESARRSEAVIERLGIAALREKKVRALSGGERRKVLVALALLADPPILVLDEPTVGLDPVARRALWELALEQRRAGKTILLTTHYMDEAEFLADRIGFIAEGRLVHVGTLAELHQTLGKSVRVSHLDASSGEVVGQHYFDTLAEAQGFVRAQGFETYSVGRVSLEDVYLRVMASGTHA